MNEFVQKLHGKKRGVNSMQYESKFQQRGKKFKRGRGGGGIDDNDEDQESANNKNFSSLIQHTCFAKTFSN